MFQKKWGWIFLVMTIASGALGLSNADGQELQKYEIRWGTAALGGNWAVLGNLMLEDILKANPHLTGSTVPMGGAANMMGVHQGKLNIAFSLSDTMGDAMEGREDFKSQGKIRNLRLLGSLFPEPNQFAVYADSGITTIPQLKGKRVTPGPKGSATEICTRRILQAYEITPKDVQWRPLSFADGGEQMADRHIDAVLYGAVGYPHPTLVNVSSQRQIRLLSLTEEAVGKLVKTYKGMVPFTLAAGSYRGVDYPVKAVSSDVVLVVREDMPEDVAYRLTKTVAQNFDRYAKSVKAMALGKMTDMSKDFGFPHHPGAMKYFRERGWMK